MAAKSRRTTPAVKQEAGETQLIRSPYSYEFFQAVRVLERMGNGESPGGFSNPSTEVVRFSAHQSLAFPASQIQSLQQRDAGPPLMVVNFMGLTGPQGVLPVAYTSLVMERLRGRDSTMRDFFDIFNHRIISLFYRAWEKYRFPVSHERGRESRVSHYLFGSDGPRNGRTAGQAGSAR